MTRSMHRDRRQWAGHRRGVLACAVLAWMVPHAATAQTAPDAGALLQQIEQPRRPELPRKSALELAPPPALQAFNPGQVSVTVLEFRFAGNTLMKGDALARAVAGYINRPLSFEELQNAAVAVASVYRKHGRVVRAYLPQQDVTAGTVTIRIIEAKFGHAVVEGQTSRVSTEHIRSLVEHAQKPGVAVDAGALDRALLLIDDLPGLSATGHLSEGSSAAETDLDVAVADSAAVSGSVTEDNSGERATGVGRIIGDTYLNGLFGVGDRIEVLLLGSQGSNYERLDYTMPVGSSGWRVGANASHLGYRVVTQEFAALAAHGSSVTAGLEATYPIIRSRLDNLYFAFNVDDKRFNNDSAGATTTRYTVGTVSAGLYGNLFDELGAGGANNAAVTLVQGNLNLGGSPNEAADAATTRAAGRFEKVRWTLSRQQLITQRLSLYANFTGQAATKNLDSSEKFYLGGSTGVRGYPENEGGGADGLLLNMEVREKLPWNFDTAAFFDYGSVRFNETNRFPGAANPNSDRLKSAGVSLAWVAHFGLSLKAMYAHRLGSNPDPTSTGADQDGSHIDNRVWLQATMPF